MSRNFPVQQNLSIVTLAVKTKLVVLQKVFEQQINSKVIDTSWFWTLQHLRTDLKNFSSWWISHREEHTIRLWLWLSRENTGSFADGRIENLKKLDVSFFVWQLETPKNQCKKNNSSNFSTIWLLQVEERTPIFHFWRCSLPNEWFQIDYRNL